VLDQTFPNVETIVVDDGSNDGTDQILRKFGKRIKFIKQSNAGPSAASNRGIDASTGTILSFLDSDDVWLPDKIERQVRVLSKGGSQMPCCICNALIVDESTKRRTSFENAGFSIPLESGYWSNPSEVLATRFVLFNQVVAVRREAMDRVGWFNERLQLLEDYDLAMRLSALGGWGIIKEPLVIKYNDTQGIGVMAMGNPGQVLPASATVLQSLLEEKGLWVPSTKHRLRKSLRRVQKDIKIDNQLSSGRRLVRLIGKIQFEINHVEQGMRRKLAGYPAPEISPLPDSSLN
jgi:glycosyltransferase involved in cell wall biosynthesis